MREVRLSTPIPKEKVLDLQLMDIVYLSGKVYVVVSPQAHMLLLDAARKGLKLPFDLTNAVVYHCPALLKESAGGYRLILVGSTTSSRFNPLAPEFIERFRVSGIIGKGGMDKATLEACKKYGCVYFSAIGGASPIYTKKVEGLTNVYWSDRLSIYEAILEIVVKDFGPLFVGMDAHGNSIYEQIQREVRQNIPKIYQILGIH